MDITTIEQVVARVASSQVQQITIEDGDTSITVINRLHNMPDTFTDSATSVESASTNRLIVEPNQVVATQSNTNEQITNAELSTITSTYVGYVQLGGDIASDPLIRVGDTVEAGQVVAYVDVLSKLMAVKSKHTGKVTEVLVENGDTIEYGQAIFRLDRM